MAFTQQPQTQIIWLHENYIIIIIIIIIVVVVVVITPSSSEPG